MSKSWLIYLSFLLSLSLPLRGQSRLLTKEEINSFASLWKNDPSLQIIPDQSFAVDVKGIGKSSFLSFQGKAKNFPYFRHWIVKPDRSVIKIQPPKDILLVPGRAGKLEAVIFTELDFDGLTDFYTIGSFRAENNKTSYITLLYIQNKDGSFTIDGKNSEVVSRRQAKNFKEVEKILREELKFLP